MPAFCARKFTFQTSFDKFNRRAKFSSTTANPNRSPGIAKIFVNDCTTEIFSETNFLTDSTSRKSINDSSTTTLATSASCKIFSAEIKLPVGLLGRPIITQSEAVTSSLSASREKFSAASVKKNFTSQPAALDARSYSEKLGAGITTRFGRVALR